MKSKTLSNQVAIVTGGGSGIGRAFTEALAREGVRVVIASRRTDALRSTANEINETLSAERVFPYEFDIRDRAQIDELARDVFERWQALDVLGSGRT